MNLHYQHHTPMPTNQNADFLVFCLKNVFRILIPKIFNFHTSELDILFSIIGRNMHVHAILPADLT
jgi:hypothetical protein